MFGTILTTTVTLFQLYVFWRASSVSALTRWFRKRTIILAGVVMWGVFMAGRLYGHGNPGLLAGGLEHVSMNWMATLFLCALCLFTIDLVTGFGWLWRRHLATLRGAALVAGVALAAIAMIQGMRPPEVTEFSVALADLPPALDGTVIIAMSDLHLGSRLNEQWLAARIAQVAAEKPDLIVLLGDIYEGHGAPSPKLTAVMARLHAPLGVWAVLGNHEFHGGLASQAGAALTDNGFAVLRNAWAEVEPGLVIAGVDDLTNGRRNGNGSKALHQALAGRPAGALILLSHSPLYGDVAAQQGVGVMLSGHTHGGQIWPFGYLVQQRYPLLEGLYQLDGMSAIVGRGTGTWGPRMRLWAPAEILRVTLHHRTEQKGSGLHISQKMHQMQKM